MSREVQLPEPLRRKLSELRLQSDTRTRREPGEALNAKARDYEVLAASEVERAPLGEPEEHLAAAAAFAAVAIALRKSRWRSMRRREMSFSVVRYGVDDITLGFEMNGLRSVSARLDELPGEQRGRGKMLGHRTSFGQGRISWAISGVLEVGDEAVVCAGEACTGRGAMSPRRGHGCGCGADRADGERCASELGATVGDARRCGGGCELRSVRREAVARRVGGRAASECVANYVGWDTSLEGVLSSRRK